MEINLNNDLYHALKFLLAAIQHPQKYGLELAIIEAREALVNAELVLDIQEVLKEG